MKTNQQCYSPMKNNTYIGEDNLLHCTVCGDPIESELCIPKTNTKLRRKCKCEREKERKEEELKQMQEKSKRFRKLQEASLIGKRYADVSFDSTEIVSPEFNKAFLICKQYCDNADEMLQHGYGLYLYGSCGVGKTHLTACMCNELISKNKHCLFTNFFEISKKIRNTFNSNESDSEIITKLCDIDYLFIDDVGTERLLTGGESNWLQEQIFDIINKRYNNKMPTILTSNHSLNMLVKKGLMEKTADRINEMSKNVFKIEGISYRQKAQ